MTTGRATNLALAKADRAIVTLNLNLVRTLGLPAANFDAVAARIRRTGDGSPTFGWRDNRLWSTSTSTSGSRWHLPASVDADSNRRVRAGIAP